MNKILNEIMDLPHKPDKEKLTRAQLIFLIFLAGIGIVMALWYGATGYYEAFWFGEPDYVQEKPY